MFIFNDKEFNNPVEIISAFDNSDFFSAFKKIEKLRKNFYLTGYISYLAGDIFLGKEIKSKTPLLYFEVHNTFNPFKYSNKNAKANLYIKENIDFSQYKNNIKKIKEYIKKGTTYEVNYTFSNEVLSDEDSFSLFLKLYKNQKTPYCAYINNAWGEILSFSPELFFKIKNNKIITKPMKGTLKRNGDDKKEIDFLYNDIKNRAENTMIVDLLRNDLAKIKGSSNINVDKLFEIETHKTLHQMTSTISASIENIDFLDIFSSLFPCGSITGAPKISTMKIIDEIENYKRDIYCGAIGIIHKNDALFSVPIRILERKKDETNYTFCSGGAIVYKSKTLDEWSECKTKSFFLGESKNFNLIETILIKNKTPELYFEHLKRLKKSASYLGFKFNNNLLNEQFEDNKIARIVLSKEGNYEIQYRKINEIKTRKIKLSDKKMYSKNGFLFHKTDFRPWYENENKQTDFFDVIFLNEKEELTEGAKSNIFLLIKDKFYTPPLKCGLLEGVFRQVFLKNKNVEEKILHLEDLFSAEKIYLTNSVRSIVEVKL